MRKPVPPLALRGVFSVLPTIFHEDGSLDPDGIDAVVMAHARAGVAGLTALGVMGEAAELSEEERRIVLGRVIAAAGLPVVVGISGDAAGIVRRRGLDAAEAGASAVMVAPSRALTLQDALAAAGDAGLPIVIQDYFAGSGVAVDAVQVVELAGGNALIAGLKAETPPTSDTIRMIRREAPGLGAMGGLGGLFLIDELRAGATGVMTGFPMPERLVDIVRMFPDDPGAAERGWIALLPLMRFEAFPPFSLAARKEVWRIRGVIESSRCRRAGVRLDTVSAADVGRALSLVGG